MSKTGIEIKKFDPRNYNADDPAQVEQFLRDSAQNVGRQQLLDAQKAKEAEEEKARALQAKQNKELERNRVEVSLSDAMAMGGVRPTAEMIDREQSEQNLLAKAMMDR